MLMWYFIHFMHTIKGRAMGITDFINPRDDERPVYEVGILCSLSMDHLIKENTIFSYIFTSKMIIIIIFIYYYYFF